MKVTLKVDPEWFSFALTSALSWRSDLGRFPRARRRDGILVGKELYSGGQVWFHVFGRYDHVRVYQEGH